MSVTTIKVTDSEKSPAIYSTNWKEQVLLKRRLADIERTKMTVAQRITLDQRIMYKRFQQKRFHSELTHARVMGDKESERSLRENSAYNFNTNCGINEEEDSILQKILQRRPPSSAAASVHRSRSVPPTAEKSHRRKSNVIATAGNNSNKVRPSTCYPSSTSKTGDYLNTSTRSQSRPDISKQELILNAFADNADDRGAKTPESPVDNQDTTRSKAMSIFEDPDERHRAILKEINRRRLQSACYDNKVRDFCQVVDKMDNKSTAAAYDYYNKRLIEETEWNPLSMNRNIPGTPETDFLKHMGNLRVKTMTMKSVHSPYLPKATPITVMNDVRRRQSKRSSLQIIA
ncbi:uncharacterized protein LOC141906422 [Tubulanus polymorphus]|uniref:uncharacterized protein LOC141906422 n=1 Tax=Tubulanus polymorphus TaxID=672921 RepID=UPI003DA50F26